MAIYIKHKIILTCVFLSVFSSCIKAHAQNIPSQDNTNTYVLEAYAKIKCIRKTSQDVLKLYREMGATPQQIAVPYIFLSFLGYPNYFAVAQDHNVCVFVFFSPTENKRKYIFLAKLLDCSTVKKIVENLAGSTEESEGWTFFAKRKEDFALIQDKKRMLIYANGQPKNDIEFGIQPSIFSLTKLTADKNLAEVLKNLNETFGSININEAQILIDCVLNEKNQELGLRNGLLIHLTQSGLTTKIIPKSKNESELHITLQRKDLFNLIHQLRAKVCALESK